MTKEMKCLGLCLALVLLVSASPAQAPEKPCCVAGEYKGSQIHAQLPNCPPPQSETFTLSLVQGRDCGPAVSGKIVNAGGDVIEFKGTITPGLRGCCNFVASFQSPGHPENIVTLKGTFCRRMLKWHAQGTYTESKSENPCNAKGKWEMSQV